MPPAPGAGRDCAEGVWPSGHRRVPWLVDLTTIPHVHEINSAYLHLNALPGLRWIPNRKRVWRYVSPEEDLPPFFGLP